MKSLLLAVILSIAAICGYAQDFPSRGISLNVPNPPGGLNQIHAQALGAVIEKLYKQPAPVLNKPGATSAAGTAYVANQPTDGYTVLFTTPNLYLALEKDKLFGIQSPYTLEQVAPVARLSAGPLFWCVQTENPIKSVKELVTAAKAKQGAMAFASTGPYGNIHVPTAIFLDAAGIKMRHVPTTGGGPALIQLLGGHVDMTAGGLASVYPHIKSGKFRPLALSGVKRSASLPNVPTFQETGYDVEAYMWIGLFTAAGVPEPTFNKLREVIRKSVADPLFQDSMTKAQVVIDYQDAPEFKKFFEEDYKRMAAAVKAIGRIEEPKN
ncbi:MAG: tripartite tricarboxylate transporter substrate binding protein [Sulfuricaulis sp.]|nr:tripartite tricarboxylate transporter substrate binding protein [Sulfuricaulis sp.]